MTRRALYQSTDPSDFSLVLKTHRLLRTLHWFGFSTRSQVGMISPDHFVKPGLPGLENFQARAKPGLSGLTLKLH